MNFSIAKYTILAATVSLAACQRDDDGYTAPIQNTAEGSMTFAASFEKSLSKAGLHYDGDSPANAAKIQTYFQSSDALSIFDGVANNKFTTTGNGASVAFEGTVKASENGYYVLFPYNQAAKLNDDGSIATNVPTKQSFKADNASGVNSALEGIVAIAHTTDNSITLKNATAIIRITTQDEIASPIKVESSQPIAGDIAVSFDKYNDPVATGATSNTVELSDAPHGGYISILPVDMADFKVTYTAKDGTPKEAFFKNVQVNRSQILNFGDIDQLLAITYNVSGFPNATLQNESIKKGSSLRLPNNLGEGIEFRAWLDGNGNTYNPGKTIENVTTDITLVALSNDDKVLTFNFNYDGNGSGKTDFAKFKTGEPVTMLADITAPEGKHLIGWDFSLYAIEPKYTPGQTIDVSAEIANLTRNIYAYYDLNDVTITLDANGGKFADGAVTKPIIRKWGEEASITDADAPEYEGFWFKAWEGIDNLDLKSDITIKAIWGKYSTITFHDFDGTALAQLAQTYKDGEPTIIRNDIKLGSNIKSWNTKQDGTGTEYFPGQEVKDLTGNIKLYPVKSEDQPSSIDPWDIKEF